MTLLPKTPPLDARHTTLSDLEPLELARTHMPKWLLDAPLHIIDALNESMAQSRSLHGQVGKKFAELQSVEVYCGALLAAEVKRQVGTLLDIHNDYLDVVHAHLITDDTLIATVRRYMVHDEPKTLLWAALQNFSASETAPGGFSPQSRILYAGDEARPSPVRPHHFAALCRTLNLGLKYRTYLSDFLGVAATGTSYPSATHLATESSLRLLKRYDMEVDAHIAFLKGKINDTAYKALLDVLAQPSEADAAATVMLDGKPMVLSSLSILDTPIDGVVIFSPDTLLLHPVNRLIAYIPNDPVAPFFEFSSLQVFTDEFKHRLLDPAYVSFFARFVALSVRADFVLKVKARPDALGLTAVPVSMGAAQYLCSVQLKNMFADAQVLAVPTGVLDEREREEQWQRYKRAGLLLINVAALFVPVLGDLMLAVAVGKMLGEVFEGVEDWSHGDIDHAREHLLNVARDIATTAAVVVGVGVVKKASSTLSRRTAAYFEGFQPISRDDGTARLWSRDLEHYAHKDGAQHRHTADSQGFFSINGIQHVEVDKKHYPVEFDDGLKQWRISHPRRPKAFKPALLHNREGAWQHVHEQPLEWASSTLLGRLGAATVNLDEQTLEQVRVLTDTREGVMRRVHLENLPPPSLLKVSLKRFEIDRQIDMFIEQMNTAEHGHPRWTDMQLNLLPSLPGWPVGKRLTVLDPTGRIAVQYANALWPVASQLDLTPSVLGGGKLLDAVLAGLPSAEGKALLGAEVSASITPAPLLAQRLGAWARDNRSQVFERFYQRFNVSSTAEARTLERDFSGLPRPVAQALVDSANDTQRQLLLTGKVPLELAEQARVLVRETRLNRALEGFYLVGQANEDTEKLVLHFLERLPGWPLEAALEIREDSILGPVTHRWGGIQVQPPKVLIKTEQGYQRYRPRGQIYILEPGPALSLSSAMFKLLSEYQRERLGFNSLEDGPLFNAALGKLAASARMESARVLGMQPIKPGFKAPVALEAGKVGYPLCGMLVGDHSWSLQRRVRDLYPGFDDNQVLIYLDALVKRGIKPLNILRERKRERRALLKNLQAWINATPVEVSVADAMYDYAESRYRVAGLIERSWRKSPTHIPWANSEELYSLNLDGFRVGNFPVLPAVADFSHIRELKLNNMASRDTAQGFLEHFSGLFSLEMDNNRMVNLPTQLQHMPNLRRLSLARNLLYLSPANAAILNRLSRLEVLNLNENLLGPLLNLGSLSYLRRVYLRRTWIEEWPEGLISRPFLETADLRENRIIKIPEQVYQAPESLTRNISLPGNPLSSASRLRLARYVMQSGSSMGINSEELMSEAAAFEFWSAGITRHELTRCEVLWNSLRADVASDDFFTVISRLTATADVQNVRQDLSRRVWEMIDAANENTELRRDLLDLAASPRSCTDSIAITFSAMEVQMELTRILAAPQTEEVELLRLAKRLFRLDELGKFASADYRARLALGGLAPDELGMHLAYRIGLAEALELKGQPESMTFSVLAGVTAEDLEKARCEVERLEQTSALNVFISTREFWKDYLIRMNRAEHAALTEPYFEALTELLRKSPEMNSGRYLRRVNEVRNDEVAAVNAWSLQKTEALLAVPQPRSEGAASTAP